VEKRGGSENLLFPRKRGRGGRDQGDTEDGKGRRKMADELLIKEERREEKIETKFRIGYNWSN